jgi:endonuclease/exonuclease/phosphatase family metal-dependent hydrolase
MRKTSLALIVFAFLCVGPAVADDPITIATWNVGLIDRSVSALKLDDFSEEVNADVLVLNEVKKIEDIQEIRQGLGREDDFIAISSFEPGDGNLEVGIISRFPISDIVEFDPFPESNQSTPAQKKLTKVSLPGIASVGVGRGFLVARIPALNFFVIAAHLKSSRGKTGQPDHTNAQKRELVAAAIADHANSLIEDFPQATVIVCGDFNVGVSDSKKNGSLLTTDTFTGNGDKYDETHALLEDGLVDGLKMKSLAKELKGTFVGDDNVPDFPGTGAIDVIYVIGTEAGAFQKAKRATDRFGSDHLAVFSSTGDGAGAGTPSKISIKKLLPNPSGADAGNERITLENTGDAVAVTGWKFSDAAGNKFMIPANTQIKNGLTVIKLTENSMPLNNSGDTVMLLNDQCVRVGPSFSYSKGDVTVGQEVER